jgi:hypothetical protein
VTAGDWGFILIAIGIVILLFVAFSRSERIDFEDWLKKRRERR